MPPSQPRSHGSRFPWPLFAAGLPLVLFLSVPCLILFFRAPLGGFLNRFEPQVAQAIELSLSTTAVTTAIAVIAGTPVAYLLGRKVFVGRAALDTLIDLPMVLPPAVAGVALLMTFGRQGFLGQFLHGAGIDVAFTPVAVVMAQLFVSSSFYVKSAAAGFAGVDHELEQAAEIDGASALKIFRSITLPLSAHAVLGGAIMTWARALGEFGATIIFAGNFPGRTQTMPLAIYIGFEIDLKSAIWLSLVLLAVSFASIAVTKGVLKQKIFVF